MDFNVPFESAERGEYNRILFIIGCHTILRLQSPSNIVLPMPYALTNQTHCLNSPLTNAA